MSQELPDIFKTDCELLSSEGDIPVWKISFPFKDADGDQSGIYLKKEGEKFLLTDDGDILWMVSGIIGADAAKSFREKLAFVATLNGLCLNVDGSLSAVCSKDALQETTGKFVKALAQADYILETMRQKEGDSR